jgi:hypothetical protein
MRTTPSCSTVRDCDNVSGLDTPLFALEVRVMKP